METKEISTWNATLTTCRKEEKEREKNDRTNQNNQDKKLYPQLKKRPCQVIFTVFLNDSASELKTLPGRFLHAFTIWHVVLRKHGLAS